jgi:hypothetical protein
METSHGHKETMAHSGLAAMLALLGFVLSATSWPPEWVPRIVLCQRWVAFVGVFFLWGLLHVYMRWQLRLKRNATIIQAGAEHALAEWVFHEPQNDDLGRYAFPKKKQRTLPSRIGAWMKAHIDFIIPFPWATTVDYGKENFPKWLAKSIEQEERDWKRFNKGEWLELAGSGVVFIRIIVRTSLAC